MQTRPYDFNITNTFGANSTTVLCKRGCAFGQITYCQMENNWKLDHMNFPCLLLLSLLYKNICIHLNLEMVGFEGYNPCLIGLKYSVIMKWMPTLKCMRLLCPITSLCQNHPHNYEHIQKCIRILVVYT